MSAMRRFTALAALALAAALGACAPSAPEGPSFYRDLSSRGAVFDAEAARSMINTNRIKEGLQPVPFDRRLSDVANAEAAAVADRAMASGKVTPSPNLPAQVAAAGYPLGAMRRNVSAGYYTIAEAFSGWRESERHRATMLMPGASAMGIAAVHRPVAKYRVYWTLIMAEQAGAANCRSC